MYSSVYVVPSQWLSPAVVPDIIFQFDHEAGCQSHFFVEWTTWGRNLSECIL